MDKKEYLKLDLELAQALLNYLAPKPYVEVFQLINSLQTLPKLEEESEEDGP